MNHKLDHLLFFRYQMFGGKLGRDYQVSHFWRGYECRFGYRFLYEFFLEKGRSQTSHDLKVKFLTHCDPI